MSTNFPLRPVLDLLEDRGQDICRALSVPLSTVTEWSPAGLTEEEATVVAERLGVEFESLWPSSPSRSPKEWIAFARASLAEAGR